MKGDVRKGPGDLPGDSTNPNSPDYNSSRDEAIDELVADWNDDDEKRRKAEEWTAGTFGCDHYTEVALALDDLHRYGATVPVLNKLHALARVESEALQEKLREMAEAEIDREDAA